MASSSTFRRRARESAPAPSSYRYAISPPRPLSGRRAGSAPPVGSIRRTPSHTAAENRHSSFDVFTVSLLEARTSTPPTISPSTSSRSVPTLSVTKRRSLASDSGYTADSEVGVIRRLSFLGEKCMKPQADRSSNEPVEPSTAILAREPRIKWTDRVRLSVGTFGNECREAFKGWREKLGRRKTTGDDAYWREWSYSTEADEGDSRELDTSASTVSFPDGPVAITLTPPTPEREAPRPHVDKALPDTPVSAADDQFPDELLAEHLLREDYLARGGVFPHSP